MEKEDGRDRSAQVIYSQLILATFMGIFFGVGIFATLTGIWGFTWIFGCMIGIGASGLGLTYITAITERDRDHSPSSDD